jgi:hypothetical protein
MKKFTLVHETPDHFVVHNGIAHFHVAKRGIDTPTADKIRMLADGGEIKKTPYETGVEAQAQQEADEKVKKDKKPEDQDEPIDYVKYNNPDKFAKGGSSHSGPSESSGGQYEDKSYGYADGGDVQTENDPSSGAQTFQDSFRKATHYADGGTAAATPEVTEQVQKAARDPEHAADPKVEQDAEAARQAKYAAIREQNRKNMQGGSSYADGGSIENETQGQAIKRYADGNPANMAKGGHIHHNAGKNQLHFHFYDGASQPKMEEEPVNLADGGHPAPMQLSAQDVDPSASIGTAQTPMQQQIDQAISDKNPTPEQTANNLAGAMGTAAPFSAPNAAPSSAPTPVDPSQQVKVAQNPPAAPGMDLMKQLETADNAEKTAIKEGATGQQQYFNKQKDIITNQMVDQQNRFDAYQKDQEQNNEIQQNLYDAVKNSKVDPNKYWNDLGTGGKIAATIGVILGGIEGGINGTHRNIGLDTLNQHIKADVDAQVADNTNKMNLYKMGLQKYHDTQAAYQFATLNANAIVAGQLEKASAGAGSAQAKAASDLAIAQLQKQSIPLKQQLAMHQVGLQMAQGGAGTKDINPEMLSDDMRDRAVRLPNGNLGLAPTKEDAALTRKAFTSYDGIDQNLNNFLTTMKKIGPTLNPWGSDAATSESAKSNIVLELNKLHDLNRLNDNEFKTYMDMVPTAGTWRPNRATAQIMSLKNLIDSKRQAEMANNIEGYKPKKFTPGAPK